MLKYIKNNDKTPVLSIILLVYFFFQLLNCGYEKENQEGMELEKSGRQAEALYIYTKILKNDPNNFTANKRTGFLLAENRASFISAIYYLEKALGMDAWRQNSKQLPKDDDVILKLFDLYLQAKDAMKAEEILNMTESTSYYSTIKMAYSCIFNKDQESIESFRALQKIQEPDLRLNHIIKQCSQRHKPTKKGYALEVGTTGKL